MDGGTYLVMYLFRDLFSTSSFFIVIITAIYNIPWFFEYYKILEVGCHAHLAHNFTWDIILCIFAFEV